jgi:hypothetical protein
LSPALTRTKYFKDFAGVFFALLFLAQQMTLPKGQSHKVVANRDAEICLLTLQIS